MLPTDFDGILLFPMGWLERLFDVISPWCHSGIIRALCSVCIITINPLLPSTPEPRNRTQGPMESTELPGAGAVCQMEFHAKPSLARCGETWPQSAAWTPGVHLFGEALRGHRALSRQLTACLGPQSGWLLAASHRNWEEKTLQKQYYFPSNFYDPEGWLCCMIPHRGRIKYHNIMCMLCTRSYHFWHRKGRWLAPAIARRC